MSAVHHVLLKDRIQSFEEQKPKTGEMPLDIEGVIYIYIYFAVHGLCI